MDVVGAIEVVDGDGEATDVVFTWYELTLELETGIEVDTLFDVYWLELDGVGMIVVSSCDCWNPEDDSVYLVLETLELTTNDVVGATEVVEGDGDAIDVVFTW